MKKKGVAVHVRSTYYTTVMSIGYGGPTYNTHRPPPPTMLFTIGLSERAILVIRLKIDLPITQVQELTLSVANMPLALHLIGSLFKIR